MLKLLAKNILIFVFLLTLAGCGAGAKLMRDQQQLRNNLLQQYKFTNDSYLAYMKKRFDIAMARAGKNNHAPQIMLLFSSPENAQPFAFAINDGEIVISQALVSSTQNEAQLAFIIAHEIGHIALGHLANPARSSEERLQQEQEADGYGLGLSALAGYDIRYGISAVLLEPELYATPQRSYPNPQERYQALQQRVLISAWRPPGTINRNDFNLFRSRVSGQP